MATALSSLTACTLTVLTGEDGSRSPTARLAGELDLDSVPAVEEGLNRLLTPGTRLLVLDLSGISFCDVSGVNLFLRLHRRCRAAGARLRLHQVPRRPARVMRELELHHLVTCLFQETAAPAAQASRAAMSNPSRRANSGPVDAGLCG